MHELTLAENIVQLALDTARRENATQISEVVVEIGELSCVEISALTFSFTIVARDTLAESANLRCLSLPGRGWCTVCQKEIPLPHRHTPCPECQGHAIEVVGGTEMRVKHLAIR